MQMRTGREAAAAAETENLTACDRGPWRKRCREQVRVQRERLVRMQDGHVDSITALFPVGRLDNAVGGGEKGRPFREREIDASMAFRIGDPFAEALRNRVRTVEWIG